MTSSQFLILVVIMQCFMFAIAIVFREDKKICNLGFAIGGLFFLFYPFIIYGIMKGY